MYKCQKCGTIVPRGIPASRVTVETRPVRYPIRREANRAILINRHWVKPDDPGGIGSEPVHEITVCPTCAETALRSD